MKFYPEKFKEIMKLKKFHIKELAEKAGLDRSTLWLWEKGKFQPSERKVRTLAKVLNISVDVISDLQNPVDISEAGIEKYGSLFSEWTSYSDNELVDKAKQQEDLLSKIKDQLGKGLLAISIFRKLLNSSDAMLYMKDINQKYISVSKKFTDLVSITEDQFVVGKTDKDLFPIKEARENEEEDAAVLLTGKAVKNREGIIPGSRKCSWGLISKLPIFDTDGKISGIIGSFVDITERKNAEMLGESLKKGLGMLDATISIAKKGRNAPEGGIDFDKYLYVSNINNFIMKEIFKAEDNLPPQKIWNHIRSIINKNSKEKFSLETLQKNKVSEIRFTFKQPGGKKYYLFNKIYYDPLSDLYVSVIVEDIKSKTMEQIAEKLRENGINEGIIKKTFTENSK